MVDARPKTSWKYALIPVIVMAILALYPQLFLWVTKTPNWQGSYFVSNYDEVAYSAYVNALIKGKPRQNDPFTGVDETGHESLYSIQFIPAYGIAIPARLLGLSTTAAFILLILLIGVFSALSMFWLISAVTGNPWLAASGTVAILCFGTAAAFQGEMRYWTAGRVLVDFLPFLRRYQPGFAFPFFFLFCAFVWRSFTETIWKRALVFALAAGVTFAFLVFSYFYLWTAAAAWLACLTAVNLISNKEKRGQVAASTGIVAAFAVAALLPYFMMLANRAPDLDGVQLLTNTHAPQFASPSLMIGLAVAIIIAIYAYVGKVSIRAPKVLFAIAFALTPLILFNQQIVTGRSLQPIHYEIFIANYLVLTSAVLLVSLFLRSTNNSESSGSAKAFIYLTVIASIWGFIEASGSTGRNAVFAGIRDQSVPAICLIEQKNVSESSRNKPPIVLATNFITSDFMLSVSTFRPLWNPHTSSAGGVSLAENKRLFYLFLYYSGFTGRDLDEALKQNVFEVTAAIFGSERALPALGRVELGISGDEIRTEVRQYETFCSSFTSSTAADPALDYIVVPDKAEPIYTNLDRWYQRDEGEKAGLFKVYKLRLRSPADLTTP